MDEYELACVISLLSDDIRDAIRMINVQSSIISELRGEISDLKSRVEELERKNG